MKQLFSLEKTSHNNATLATIQLFKALQVPVTNKSIIETLENHVDYPSLLSVSDTLRTWNVDNWAIETTQDDLAQLTPPFLVYTKDQKFLLVKSMDNGIQYVDDKGKDALYSPQDFARKWENIVLVPSTNQRSGDYQYKSNRKAEIIGQLRLPAILILGLLLIVSSVYSDAGISYFSLFYFSKFTGTIIASLLLWFDIDQTNPALHQICSSNRKVNCSAVLSSNGAKLFGLLSWSEVGFYYFTGGLFLLFIGAVSNTSPFASIFWLSLFAVPYIAYSIIYQWKVAKQWCKLCLYIQGLLLLEASVSIYTYLTSTPSLSVNIASLQFVLLSFSIPVIFWIFTKRVLQTNIALKTANQVGNKIYRNPKVFYSILVQQKHTIADDTLGIVFGNPRAEHVLTKVCNPFCGPCRRAHTKINELLNRQNLKIQIIFSGIKENPNDRVNLMVEKFMSIYLQASAKVFHQALDDWYLGSLTSDQFLERYKAFQPTSLTVSSMDRMRAWCKQTDIQFTPTYFFDHYQLPEGYEIQDLKGFL